MRFARWRAARREGLRLDASVSPHLRFARLEIAESARLEIGPRFFTERQPGNHFFLHAHARVRLGAECWLRTEYGRNHITAFEGATVDVGPGAFINGAMLHAKREIRIGCDLRMGFGSRILDADLHDVDCETPERIAPVSIGDRVWLGADVLVLRGASIGDDVVIGAGSVVTGAIPARCVAVGAPARPVRSIASREGCR